MAMLLFTLMGRVRLVLSQAVAGSRVKNSNAFVGINSTNPRGVWTSVATLLGLLHGTSVNRWSTAYLGDLNCSATRYGTTTLEGGLTAASAGNALESLEVTNASVLKRSSHRDQLVPQRVSILSSGNITARSETIRAPAQHTGRSNTRNSR
jgi:hypothetical protein